MEHIKDRFNVIRPYFDEEVSGAVKRVVQHAWFKNIIHYLYENDCFETVISNFGKIGSVDAFQREFSDHAVKKVIEKTSDGLTFGGLENLVPDKGYLFVANHRDIVLDSAIMQMVLLANGHKTSQITFGSNLMSSQFVIDLGKLNKMFTFFRGGSRIEQYQNAMLHSAYIHHAVRDRIESVWIAQRDGRTKDGDDKTQVALLKMFSLGYKDVCEGLEPLNIVPLTVSYEYEPCAASKLRELYVRGTGQKYVKQPGEDFESVLSGITGYKGRIHLEFGKPLNGFVRELSASAYDQNERAVRIASEIDRQVYINYKLNGINYMAYDLMNDGCEYAGVRYSNDEMRQFLDYMAKTLSRIEGDRDVLKQLFLKMYAGPVINMLNARSLS
ncbi:MAG: hypothetical protein QM786_11590 [Breznakibacter sp.]